MSTNHTQELRDALMHQSRSGPINLAEDPDTTQTTWDTIREAYAPHEHNPMLDALYAELRRVEAARPTLLCPPGQQDTLRDALATAPGLAVMPTVQESDLCPPNTAYLFTPDPPAEPPTPTSLVRRLLSGWFS